MEQLPFIYKDMSQQELVDKVYKKVGQDVLFQLNQRMFENKQQEWRINNFIKHNDEFINNCVKEFEKEIAERISKKAIEKIIKDTLNAEMENYEHQIKTAIKDGFNTHKILKFIEKERYFAMKTIKAKLNPDVQVVFDKVWMELSEKDKEDAFVINI